MAPFFSMILKTLLRRNSMFLDKRCQLIRCMRIARKDATKKNAGLAPVAEIVAEPVGFSRLLKPFAFTVSFCGLSFAGATIWQYERMRSHANYLRNQWQKSSYKTGEIRRKLNSWWNSNSEGQKVAWAIIGMNVAVFFLWRVPALQPTMLRYFTSNPASRTVCLPMVLSNFSHYSLFHLAANMCVLYSFSTSAVALFGREQFVALYMSAGVVSSFMSYVHKIAARQLNPSLGASGALMAILAAICFHFPNAQLSILFLPFIAFPAGTAIKVVMGLDFTGLVMRWKLFDHAAHLGGAACGALYLWYGQEYIWRKREPLMQRWHSIRNSPSDN